MSSQKFRNSKIFILIYLSKFVQKTYASPSVVTATIFNTE